MLIKIYPSAVRRIEWYEFTIRFFFGGLITVIAGVIAKKYGPGVGGLFLAFPAIFPASTTLVEKKERQRKQHKGLHGTQRGRQASALDANGAAMGSIGLIGFALLAWELLPYYAPLLVLAGSSIAWLSVSLLAWRLRHLGSLMHK